MAATANSWKIGAGKWKTKFYPKTASVAIATGVLVENASGRVKEATTTAGATDTPVVGIYDGPAITSASATYADESDLAIRVPAEPLATAIGKVDTGSLSSVMIMLSYDISATNGVTVSTSSNEPVTCVRFISATEGEFVLTNASSPAA